MSHFNFSSNFSIFFNLIFGTQIQMQLALLEISKMRLFEIFTHCGFVKASLIRREQAKTTSKQRKKVSNYTKPFFLFWFPLETPYKYNNPHNYKEIEKGHFGAEPAHTSRFLAFFRPRREIISIVLLTNALFWRRAAQQHRTFKNCTNRFDYVNILLHFFRYATTPVG